MHKKHRHVCAWKPDYSSMIDKNSHFASHAGIFISVNGEKLIGENLISTIVNDVEQDFLILAIQRELVELAQKGLYVV